MSGPAETAPVVGGGLYAKLAEIVAEVTEVSKDGRNQHFNYDYTSAEAMLRALRGPLAARNVVLLASVTRVDDQPYKTVKEKDSVITTVHLDFTFVDGDTGDMHKCSWAGRGDDNADKGLSKAYTNAIKTFLKEQFLIPQGDDQESAPARGENGRSSSGPATISQAQYKELVRVFNAAGQPLEALALHLGCEATFEALDAHTAPAARKVTSEQADAAIAFVKALPQPTPTGA